MVANYTTLFFIGLKYDAIILDVDSKDPTAGISGPPVEFVETNVLNDVAAILNDDGKYSVVKFRVICTEKMTFARSRRLIFDKFSVPFGRTAGTDNEQVEIDICRCFDDEMQRRR